MKSFKLLFPILLLFLLSSVTVGASPLANGPRDESISRDATTFDKDKELVYEFNSDDFISYEIYHAVAYSSDGDCDVAQVDPSKLSERSPRLIDLGVESTDGESFTVKLNLVDTLAIVSSTDLYWDDSDIYYDDFFLGTYLCVKIGIIITTAGDRFVHTSEVNIMDNLIGGGIDKVGLQAERFFNAGIHPFSSNDTVMIITFYVFWAFIFTLIAIKKGWHKSNPFWGRK
ncbi:MAG: hypothetical protein HeimC2_32920 [Candidatus Heimdallarchaeota archaeon LC_2]|nr:MAG: hypothetical protein HeimC2_32920 [Candidatus Heimdallarchaeota archaeon LC_2]